MAHEVKNGNSFRKSTKVRSSYGSFFARNENIAKICKRTISLNELYECSSLAFMATPSIRDRVHRNENFVEIIPV